MIYDGLTSSDLVRISPRYLYLAVVNFPKLVGWLQSFPVHLDRSGKFSVSSQIRNRTVRQH